MNRTAKGIVLVPSLLLGSAFLAAGVWGEAAGSNRSLALGLGAVLMGAGLLAQLFPEAAPEASSAEQAGPQPQRPGR
ncbi:MAG: hypothetical protein RLZZ423_1704 [Cyanobacteriota bacterium]|jgi:uncharacterized membrane protein